MGAESVPPDVRRQIIEAERNKEGGPRGPVGLGSQIDRKLRESLELKPAELLDRKEREPFVKDIDRAMAFAEGIPGIHFDFDLNPETSNSEDFDRKKQLAEMHTRIFESIFLSREGSRERPVSWTWATLQEVTGERRSFLEGSEWGEDKSPVQEELDTFLSEQLLRVQARNRLDIIFRQRQLLAEDMGATQDAMSKGKDIEWRPLQFPDRIDWEMLFSGELGNKIDAGLRKIVEMGENGIRKGDELLLKDPYAKGIIQKEHISQLLANLYKACGNRMDAAVIAWRVASVWEIFAKYGVTTEEKDGVHEFKIGDSIFVPDWYANTAYSDIKRLTEAGCTLNKSKDWRGIHALANDPDALRELLLGSETGSRTKDEIYFNKVGLPLSIGRGMGLISPKNFLEAAELENADEKKGDKTFWDRWIGGKKLGELPWRETEKVAAGTDEAAAKGSFQFWAAINRGRAMALADTIISMPETNDLAKFSTWAGIVRNWDKVRLPRESRKWLVLSRIYPYRVEGYDDKSRPEDITLGAGSKISAEWLVSQDLAQRKVSGPSLNIILAQAERATFITREEAEWIRNTEIKPVVQILKENT